MVNVTDGAGKRTDIEDITSDLEIIKTSYHFNNADEQLKVATSESPGELFDLYLEWLK